VDGIQDHEGTNSRTCYILDAIASTSVSKKKKQVLAVALRFDRDAARINLVLAENEGVQKGLRKHLDTIWTKLQQLSEAYDLERGGRDNNFSIKGKVSVKEPVEVSLSLRVDIFREVNMYCLPKHWQTKRLEMWVVRLEEFVEKLVLHRASKKIDLNEVVSPFPSCDWSV